MVERTRNAPKKYGGQFCYVIKILFHQTISLCTSISWCNPSLGWNYKIVLILPHMQIQIIFIGNNIPENNSKAPLLGLAKSIY